MTLDISALLAEAKALVTTETARLDKAFHDHHAARVLYNLNRRFDQESTFEAITEKLRATADDTNPKTMHKRLAAQVHTLDAAFYWLMDEAATDKYSSLARFKNAFIAQSHFRQSLQLFTQLNAAKSEKRTNKRTDKEDDQ